MMKNKGCRGEIAGAIHEMMQDAQNANVVSRATMRTFDEACLVPIPVLDANKIRSPSERE